MAAMARQLARSLLAAVLVCAAAGSAFACIICLSAVSVTTGQRIDAANLVVLAEPITGSDEFRIVETIKGEATPGTTIDEAAGPLATVAPDGKPHLLIRNAMSQRWTILGQVGAGQVDWLRRFVATGDGAPSSRLLAWPLSSTAQAVPDTTDWPARIAVVASRLERPDPLVAEIAFGELARAPYEAMRLLEPVLDVDKLRRWAGDPALALRRDAYLLLLGIAGDTEDALAIEGELADARASNDATNLAALLAADLELRGPDRLAWIEKHYLTDPARSLPEIEAALLALSVHGNAQGAIPREAIVAAYRSFIRAHQPMAGFVVSDLGAWQAWDAVPELLDALGSNAVKDPAGRFAIIVYLQESPRADAHAAAASARQVN